MFKGRASIGEIINLPNRIYIGLLNIKQKELMTSEGAKAQEAQLMEDEIEELI